jgi:hypothetical protein
MRTTTFRSTTGKLPWFSGVWLCCLGCGQSQGGPVPQDQLIDRAATAVCAGLKACCQGQRLAIDATRCKSSSQQALGGTFDGCWPGTTYDAETAGECVQQMQSYNASCGKLGVFPPAVCSLVCRPTQSIGDVCQSSDACIQPATGQIACDTSTGQGGICTLVSRGKLGDSCSGTCAPHLCGLPMTMSPSLVCYRDDGLY